jgi:hypothetical protein
MGIVAFAGKKITFDWCTVDVRNTFSSLFLLMNSKEK